MAVRHCVAKSDRKPILLSSCVVLACWRLHIIGAAMHVPIVRAVPAAPVRGCHAAPPPPAVWEDAWEKVRACVDRFAHKY
eukprot:COSAG05_NODE_1354_length_5108_cov_24.726692_3_plen_80_part_00